MRDQLAKSLLDAAEKNPRLIVLSGDHGHDFFKVFRERYPNQFINCGIIEPAMVGIAAGLARTGFYPVVYGLASFIPMKTIEQIKLDFCQSGLAGLFIGDGAGFVYSTMGPSHQCIEDLACLRSLPIEIYTPSDSQTMKYVVDDILDVQQLAYIRVGKNGLQVHAPRFGGKTCLLSHGSLAETAEKVADFLCLPCHFVHRLKPLPSLDKYIHIIVIEDHARQGGLFSALTEYFADTNGPKPRIDFIGPSGFSEKTGSYQYVLSTHRLDERSIQQRVIHLIEKAGL